MNQEKLKVMQQHPGYITALDFADKAPNTVLVLKNYGIAPEDVDSDEKANLLANRYRERMFKSKAYNSDKICGCIVMDGALNYEIDGKCTAEYLWEEKGIVTFLAVSNDPLPVENGVRLMHPIYNLEGLLAEGVKHGVFGTKAYTDIFDYNEKGIKALVDQQLFVGRMALRYGLVPILEPCVAIGNPQKEKCEQYLHDLLKEEISKFGPDDKIILKLTLPEKENLYLDLLDDPHVIRIVGLSGGYTQEESCKRLAKNHKMVASFARAFMEGLKVYQSDEEFEETISKSIENIYQASIL